jgi:glutaredoxin
MGYNEQSADSLKNNRRLIVYTTNGCIKCTTLKAWLKNRNTDYEEKNLEDTDVMTDLVMRDIVVLSAPALETEKGFFTEDQIFDQNGMLNGKISELLQGGLKPV